MARIKRSNFTDAEIKSAWNSSAYSHPDTKRRVWGVAALLTELGRGNVSRNICRYWLRQLKLIDQANPGMPRGPYTTLKKDGLEWTRSRVADAVESQSKGKHDGPKVLSIDIETSPITGYVWSLWKQNVGLNQIKDEWNILSFCAKWLHEDDPIYEDCRENPRDDSKLLDSIWKLLDEADIVITQNGKRFDVPKINARFVMGGKLPPSPYKIVDTMLIAKQQFAFTSKKLEWMTDKLCQHHKKNTHAKFPGFELWAQCMLGNPEAWDEMREYNIPDVLSMEELYLIIRPWFIGHPNMAIYFHDDEPKLRCPKCGGLHIEQKGWTFTQSGKYPRMHCNSCGGWSRGRYTMNSKEERNVQLSN
ncbi:hypothetical protein D3C77_34650 [compost metagenome]